MVKSNQSNNHKLHALTHKQLEAANKQPAPVYIFSGPATTTKLNVALEFGTKLAGGEQAASQYLIWLAPERSLGIADVRQLLENLALKPMQAGQYRVVVLESAERMSNEAANALLKVLEEPPEQTVFVLVTTSVQALLPTIRSRAQLIRFVPSEDDYVVDDKTLELARDYLAGNVSQAFLIAKQVHEKSIGSEFLQALYIQARQMDGTSTLLELCLAAEQQLSANLNTRLVFENFALLKSQKVSS